MSFISVSQLCEATGGRLLSCGFSSHDAARQRVGSVTIDSRQVERGQTFWALPGNRRHGAGFIDDAFANGACGAVTDRDCVPADGRWAVRVDDSLAALHRLAAWQRRQFGGKVVAVTGSVGKTTTRALIECILRTYRRGSGSRGNFNNHLGLPLSMLDMRADHDYGLFELGSSAAGEIAALASLCRPDLAVLTRVAEAHLGGFGSLQALAAAKLELLDALPNNGRAIIFGDDPWLRKLVLQRTAKSTFVGRDGNNDLQAAHVECSPGWLKLSIRGVPFEVPLWGRHHVTAVLAAVAVGESFGLSLADMAEALADFQAPAGRCQVRPCGDATLIDDAYNASPASMRAALAMLRDYRTPGRRIVVCGDMRELGPAAGAFHKQLGNEVVSLCGADLLVACGSYARETVCGARRAGMPATCSIACEGVRQAAETLEQEIGAGDVVLVKGSRAMRMERVIDWVAGVDRRSTSTKRLVARAA